MGVLRSDIRPGKLLSNALMAPLHAKQSVSVENNAEDLERKENITAFRGATCSAIMLNRKEAGPSHSKKALRVSSAVQVRGGNSRSVKPLKNKIYWTDKIPKFKQFNQKPDGSSGEPSGESDTRVTHLEIDRKPKLTTVSDQCLYKQSPKRLKISKGDDGGKIKLSDWSKEDALPGPSCSDMVTYSRLNRPVSSGEAKKRPAGKTKQQSSPLKFKKSLEKRRGSDASRKKSKTLFKKAGKIILTNDLNKNSVERKRRKN